MIAQASPSLLDSLFDYGPLIYAAVMIPLLALVIVGIVIELRREGRS